jgi:alpha-ketoglutarate-dependent 2,4-dichlorophenoxyacetate dioxygenase
MKVEPITPVFAARVTGIDLKGPLDDAAVRAIEAACDEHGMLVFPDQHLSTEELVAYGRRFGPIDTSLQQKLMNRFQTRLNNDEVSDISNLAITGEVAPPEHPQTIMNVGNRFWHSDRSFAHLPDRYSIWSAFTVVDEGGETDFADLRAAYDSLDPVLKEFIADKHAVFYSHNTRDWLCIGDSSEERHAYPPVKWPMVRTHPGSKRKLIWCDSKVCRIVELSLPEGRAIIHELIEHIGEERHRYRHSWRPGDLVMVDNRCTLHRGRRFDLSQPRELRRVEIVDDVPSLGELTWEEAVPQPYA